MRTKAVIFTLALLLTLGVVLFAKFGRENVDVLIPRGSSLAHVAEVLAQNEVIRYPKLVRVILRFTGGATWVQAGEYRMKKGMGTIEAVLSLYHSEPILHPVTIPEGWNVRQIAKILSAENLIEENKFLKLALSDTLPKKYGIRASSVEGYLFPDTYHFSRIDGEERILTAMIQQFMSRWEKDYKNKLPSTGLTREKVIILASIVEKETGKDFERPLVASVFYNRMKKGMRLQSDPTTIYGIPHFNGNLTKADLLRYSPYNTYVIQGLPVGPISNPGDGSIRAVLQPATTPFFYFVSKNDGTHHFSETYKEHARNVNSFQPIRKPRKSR